MNADWPLLSEVLILALRAKVVVKVVEASEEQRFQKMFTDSTKVIKECS